jgi:hypothetical protein
MSLSRRNCVTIERSCVLGIGGGKGTYSQAKMLLYMEIEMKRRHSAGIIKKALDKFCAGS